MKTKKCPVCEINVDHTKLSFLRFGILYYFCSQQCLDNFVEHPKLYVGMKSPKQEGKSVIKRRSFVLDAPISESEKDTLRTSLSELMGVSEIQVSEAKVIVTYDLLETTVKQVEHAFELAGSKMGAGWASRLKRGWIHYTEENALGNLAAAGAACCNKPPGKG